MNSIYFINCQSATENERNLLIRSAVRRAESTGAECTAKDIAEMLTTQPSDDESLGDEEMSGTDDLPLRDLKVEHVKCRKSEIGEVTMADFSSDEESSDDIHSVLARTAGRSSRPSAAQGMAVGLMNKVTKSSKKWIQSKKKKPRKKKQNGPKEMPSNSEKWDNFFKKARSAKARKKKKNIKTIEEAREEEEEERLRLQSAAYYELNKPTKEWVFNSHLLDTDYDDDEDDYGM